MIQRIGFIGAGKMGVGIVSNLLKAGHIVTILQHKNPDNPAKLDKEGAHVTNDLATCVADQDVLFTCLPSMKSWEDIYSRIEQDVSKGTLVIDLTSAQPQRTAQMAASLADKGIDLVDAPMLRGPSAARNASIHLLVGGAEHAIERAMPLFSQISEQIYQTGGPGTGHALKLINNAVTLSNSAIVYEAFALAAHLGIDLDLAWKAMDASAASSKRLNAIAPILISGEHPPSFDVGTALKDIELYSDMAKNAEALSISGAATCDLYRLGQSFGLGDQPVTRLGELLFGLYSGQAKAGQFSHSISDMMNRKSNDNA